MPAARPSSNFKDKTNITPSVNRKTEATAEDFQEAGQIFEDHANRIDQLENELYHQDFIGYFSSLASLQANYPTAPDQSFAIIVNGANVPQEIYRYINNTWTASQTYKAILTYPTKADFPNPGQEETLYFAKDNKKSWLWYDSKYNDITAVGGATGQITASDVAVDSSLLAQTDGATQEEVNEDFDTAITANEQQAEENRTELVNLKVEAVKTTPQTLTEQEQTQARENISAAPEPKLQEIPNGGNYHNVNLTGNILVLTNTNAQAIFTGFNHTKYKRLTLINNGDYEAVLNNEDANSLPENQIKLPTGLANVGIEGSCELVYVDAIQKWQIVDTFASKYRPEHRGLTETHVEVVTPGAKSETVPITELIVFRDAQSTAMSKADLNTAYPNASRGFQVVCKEIDTIYIKTDNNTNDWQPITTGGNVL